MMTEKGLESHADRKASRREVRITLKATQVSTHEISKANEEEEEKAGSDEEDSEEEESEEKKAETDEQESEDKAGSDDGSLEEVLLSDEARQEFQTLIDQKEEESMAEAELKLHKELNGDGQDTAEMERVKRELEQEKAGRLRDKDAMEEVTKENARLKVELEQLTGGGGQGSVEMARTMSQYACALCRSHIKYMEHLGKMRRCHCNANTENERSMLDKEMTSAKMYLKRKYPDEFLEAEKVCALENRRAAK